MLVLPLKKQIKACLNDPVFVEETFRSVVQSADQNHVGLREREIERGRERGRGRECEIEGEREKGIEGGSREEER